MIRSQRFLQRFPWAFALLLLLLPALGGVIGCGGGPDEGSQAKQGGSGGEEAERPEAPADQNQGGGRRGAKGHVTLTGALTFDGDTAMGCDVFSDKGLEVSMDQTGTRAPQVQVRIADYAGAGEYPATVVIREHPESGPVHEWNGSAKVQVQSRQAGRKKRTALSGTFNGTYTGEGGQGTVAGSFRRCMLKDLVP
ncbi:MAG TPA: hypothetical protein VHC97_17325 [Thermoanaerobaculia bacterium]|jgi:hypothetical protein|nr:hypothetical protein [Thermoanaerobaculia bacterium]